MKYIIMCGGRYDHWQTPKQLSLIQGEPIVARTIRLLRENNINDIAISSNNPIFEQFGVPVLKHENKYHATKQNTIAEGYWYEAFYPIDEPVCYIFGDVVFSFNAIQIIARTKTEAIQFFASAPPFDVKYIKPWAEPFALKVVDTHLLHDSIQKVKKYNEQGLFKRRPIMWELWQVIKGTPLNKIDYTNYVVINDYTCDIDEEKDIRHIERNM